ncbi:MAG: rod shape-determining protein MreD [Acidimicrobiia bacterium]|nr:rod shape-determining protein MreD [Acidimicrobiia bacterium]
MNAPGFRMAAIVGTMAVAQVAVFSQFRLGGVAVDALLCLTIAAGLTAGDRRGALMGFTCGVVADLLITSRPLGLSALGWTIVGYLVGRYQGTTTRSSPVVASLVAVVGTVGAVVLYLLSARVLAGLDLVGPQTVRVVAVMALANAVLVHPFTRLTRWIWVERSRPGVRFRV